MNAWSGPAISLGATRFGENDAILEVFSEGQGRARGLVHGGAGRTKRALLEPGTRLHAAWKARNDDALGHFDALEASGGGPADVMDDPAALLALQSLASLLRDTTPERSAMPGLFAASAVLLDSLREAAVWPALYVRWETGLLAEQGFGLDLSVCALSGTHDDLAWVSPRTGKAASRAAGAPYADKLLPLPPFLLAGQNAIASGDVADGFALTGWFITRELLEPARKDMPDARGRLIIALGRSGRL